MGLVDTVGGMGDWSTRLETIRELATSATSVEAYSDVKSPEPKG